MGLLEYISLIDFLATSATISTVLQFLTGLFINMQEIHKKEVNWRHLGTAVYFWFSVDARWTFWLVVAGISTTFGAAVPTGYNIGVINAPANFIKIWCNETLFETYGSILSEDSLNTFWAAVVSIFLVGGVIGSLGGAWVADKLGRTV
ncbi:solute carrier family 2, facilitated glucose transporter member 9 isoform X6 [Uranotaenia lowii]|uniref:solute carrier family 2, facilitated glucose transporter member 9 isoform X6 n=1 Tax=Uranotaenia lowii TaxID=190385 RepID=UPI00247A4B65|nr:solute carrier family 2, facilitated glucose transporter member 9 isoform X6 [Uranotaenia lowii]